MAPFKSFDPVAYSPCIVTMAVSLAVSEICSAKNGLTLKSAFGIVQDH